MRDGGWDFSQVLLTLLGLNRLSRSGRNERAWAAFEAEHLHGPAMKNSGRHAAPSHHDGIDLAQAFPQRVRTLYARILAETSLTEDERSALARTLSIPAAEAIDLADWVSAVRRRALADAMIAEGLVSSGQLAAFLEEEPSSARPLGQEREEALETCHTVWALQSLPPPNLSVGVNWPAGEFCVFAGPGIKRRIAPLPRRPSLQVRRGHAHRAHRLVFERLIREYPGDETSGTVLMTNRNLIFIAPGQEAEFTPMTSIAGATSHQDGVMVFGGQSEPLLVLEFDKTEEFSALLARLLAALPGEATP